MSTNSGINKIYRRDNQPFAQIPNQAIRDPQITPSAFRLLAYLMSHQDGYELTYTQIERETGMGRYAINEAIRVLEYKGWLKTEITKTPTGQFGPKAWYVLNPADSTTVGNSTAGDSTTEKPTDIRRTLNKEHKEEEVIAQQVEPDFLLWWSFYPRKVGRGAAVKAYKAAHAKVGAKVLFDAVEKFAADPNLPPKVFIPHPATWLADERWNDEPYPERVLSKEEREAKELADREARRVREAEERERKRLQREQESLEAEEARKSVEFCEHGRVAIICNKCPNPNLK